MTKLHKQSIYRIICFFIFLVLQACGQDNFKNDNNGSLAVVQINDTLFVKDNSKEAQNISFRLDTMFEKMVMNKTFNGSVLVAKDNKVIYSKHYGLADFENKIPITDSSIFQLASVSKTITAAATLYLVQNKLIDLDAPVSKYLEGFPYENIQVKHLLCHRSGLPNYLYAYADDFSKHAQDLSNKVVFETICAKKLPLYFQPNRQFQYSNTNYALLAYMIETISKKSFVSFIKEYIFTPCKMDNSEVGMDCDVITKCTKAYNAKWQKVAMDMFDKVYGDKGIYCSVNDLYKFSHALYNGQLIRKSLLDSAFTGMSPEKKLSNYGFGFRLKNDEKGNKLVYHNGWWHGYRTAFQHRMKDNVTIIVFSNKLDRCVYNTWRIFNCIDPSQNIDEDKED